ncbi:hypothetical protein LC147_05975 [Vibrio harveyi]|uniref:hypothetical protein n=1 Tax=Vibrio harveyi TaxID=669 RepID=UPI003BB48D4E
MSCEDCSDAARKINDPKDLANAMCFLNERTEAKTLKYLGYGSWGEPFSQMVNRKGWNDLICNYFACRTCGQVFNLYAETYHGSGGAIAAIDSIAGKLFIDEFVTSQIDED